MKISQVVAELLEIQDEHGDLEVEAYSYGEIDRYPAAPTVCAAASGPPVALIEP